MIARTFDFAGNEFMTRSDRRILFMALSFFAVVTKGGEAGSSEAAKQVHELTDLVERFVA